jgi:hypothetical protein
MLTQYICDTQSIANICLQNFEKSDVDSKQKFITVNNPQAIAVLRNDETLCANVKAPTKTTNDKTKSKQTIQR